MQPSSLHNLLNIKKRNSPIVTWTIMHLFRKQLQKQYLSTKWKVSITAFCYSFQNFLEWGSYSRFRFHNALWEKDNLVSPDISYTGKDSYSSKRRKKEHREPFSEAAQKTGFLREEPVPLHKEQCDGWLWAEPQESRQTLSLLFSPQAAEAREAQV